MHFTKSVGNTIEKYRISDNYISHDHFPTDFRRISLMDPSHKPTVDDVEISSSSDEDGEYAEGLRLLFKGDPNYEKIKDEYWMHPDNKHYSLAQMTKKNLLDDKLINLIDVFNVAERQGCIPELLGSDSVGSVALRPFYHTLTQLDRLILLDDKDKLVTFFEDYRDLICRFRIYEVWLRICDKRAVSAAAALLESSLSPKLLQIMPPLGALYIGLEMVIQSHSLSYGLIDLVLRYGVKSNSKFLTTAFAHFSQHRLLRGWIPSNDLKSFAKLIFLLHLPELKESVDTIALLASHTPQLETICTNYAKHGRILNLAILLIRHWDKLMVPSSSDHLQDAPIMVAISDKLQQDWLSELNSIPYKWELSLNFIRTLWQAKHILARYPSSKLKHADLFDLTSDLVLGLEPLSYDDIHRLLPDFNLMHKGLSSRICVGPTSLSSIKKPALGGLCRNLSVFPALALPSTCSSRFSHTLQTVASNVAEPVQNQLSERSQVKLSLRNVFALTRVCAPLSWIARRSIK